MNTVPIYQVDAFAEKPFTGNPAAVVIFKNWPEEVVMQNIAFENNLSETAFLVKQDDSYHVRYFTPSVEVDLCGHATLASGYVLFNFYEENETITFRTQSKGDLFVTRRGNLFILDFPTDKFVSCEVSDWLVSAVGIKPLEAFNGLNDLMLVFEDEEQIQFMKPNLELLRKVRSRGVCVTAPGKEVDFVSRFFAPQSGINEDPVTGSTHTMLIPYWSSRLNKSIMIARQLSKRGGTVYCELLGERVKIGGKALHYLTGNIWF